MIRTAIWGKPSLHPNDIDRATVRDFVTFMRRSQRFSYIFGCFRGWLVGPACSLVSTLQDDIAFVAPKWKWKTEQILMLLLLLSTATDTATISSLNDLLFHSYKRLDETLLQDFLHIN